MNNGNGEPNSISRIRRAESKTGDKKTGTRFVPFDNEEKEELDKIKEDLNKPIDLEKMSEDLKKKIDDAKKTDVPEIVFPEPEMGRRYYDDVAGPIQDPWSRDPSWEEDPLEEMVMDGANNPGLLGGSRLDDMVMDGVNHPSSRSRRENLVLDGAANYFNQDNIVFDGNNEDLVLPRNSKRSDYLID
jgi:hypothetical protein